MTREKRVDGDVEVETKHKQDGHFRDRSKTQDDLVEFLVVANRTTKVVKGGRRFGFAVVVVVGNKNGMVGAGLGKAKEVSEARSKALQEAKKSMFKIPMTSKRTVPHDVSGHFGAGSVKLRAARPGAGIIAGGAMRVIFEAAGVRDIVAKSLGSSNPHNVIGATFDALKKLRSPRDVFATRGLKIEMSAQEQS